MKTQVTKKFVKNNFENVIISRYCEFDHELKEKGLEPTWYTCGVYGWNADVYMLDVNTVLVTGYRPFGKRLDHDKVVEMIRKAWC